MAIKHPYGSQRNRELVKAVYHHRCLSREQILKRFDYSPTYLSKSLSALVREDFLVRKYAQSFSGSRHFAYYQLGSLGASALAQEWGEIKWKRSDNLAAYTPHHAEINDYAIAVHHAWQPASVQFYSENLVTHSFEYRGQQHIFKPDGAFMFQNGTGARALVFVERERTLQAKSHVKHKLENYSAFLHGAVERIYDRDNFLIVFLCNDENAVQRWQSWISQWLSPELTATVTSFERAMLLPIESIFSTQGRQKC